MSFPRKIFFFCHSRESGNDIVVAGGDIAGGARKKLEKKLGRSIVSKNNFKKLSERKKNVKNLGRHTSR